MALVSFMASPVGRIARIVAGLLLMLLGFVVLGGTGGVILGIVGVLPVLTGALDVCLFAPLFGAPLHGAPR